MTTPNLQPKRGLQTVLHQFNPSLRTFSNYTGQLRLYSYSDLLLLFLAFEAGWRQIIGASLLWFGFLVHLEWQHKDVGRSRWPWLAWALLWVAGLGILPTAWSALVLLTATVYSLKKRVKVVGALSFLINGCVKGSLFAAAVGTGVPMAIVVVILVTSLRNLVGDVRDAGKDASEGVVSLPVLLGYRRNTRVVYPTALAATSALWILIGGLPLWMFVSAFIVQRTTYGWTPR